MVFNGTLKSNLVISFAHFDKNRSRSPSFKYNQDKTPTKQLKTIST